MFCFPLPLPAPEPPLGFCRKKGMHDVGSKPIRTMKVMLTRFGVADEIRVVFNLQLRSDRRSK